MGAPNDPGVPRSGDPGANGSISEPGLGSEPGRSGTKRRATAAADPAPDRIADPVEVPPWQRGPARGAAAKTPPRAAEKAAPRPEPPRRPVPAGGAAGPRPNRYVVGVGSGAGVGADTEGAKRPAESARRGEDATEHPSGEHPRTESYGSEIPDLSAPLPRPPQRRPDRPARPAAAVRTPAAARHQGPVRANLQIRRVDPWSVLKVSLLLSVASFFVWMIAVAFLYLVLGGMGVWSKLNSNVGDLLSSAGGSAGGELVSAGTIFGGATLIGLVNIVILTAMATIGAFIYNLSTDIVGGIEVTLADRD